MVPYRVGFGYDVHRLGPNRELWIGGIKIEHDLGAIGHSDADVLLHAICDALLGALSLGDIGQHFPDTSNEFKGIDSKILLEKTCSLVREKGWELANIDCSLSLERPKVMKHANLMKEAISKVARISVDQISIKATTGEKMGFVGREEGLCAYAVALIHRGQG